MSIDLDGRAYDRYSMWNLLPESIR